MNSKDQDIVRGRVVNGGGMDGGQCLVVELWHVLVRLGEG